MSETPQTPPPPKPAAPAAPAGRSVDEIKRDPLIAGAVARVADAVLDAKEFVGEITLVVERDRIVDVCRAMKDDGFDYLVDLSGVDYSTYPGWSGARFGVSYMLYSFAKNERVRLKVTTTEDAPRSEERRCRERV